MSRPNGKSPKTSLEEIISTQQPIGKGRIVSVYGPQWISTLRTRISDLCGTVANGTIPAYWQVGGWSLLCRYYGASDEEITSKGADVTQTEPLYATATQAE